MLCVFFRGITFSMFSVAVYQCIAINANVIICFISTVARNIICRVFNCSGSMHSAGISRKIYDYVAVSVYDLVAIYTGVKIFLVTTATRCVVCFA